jgi:hypothetical protein
MSDTQKQTQVQKQTNGASPKPKPQNNKNTNANTSNDGFKSFGKPRNQQNGANANGSPKPKDNTNKPKQPNNNNNNQQRRRKEGGNNNNNNNNKPKQQGNQQQAPSTPTLKGKLTTEQYELVLEVVQGTGGYFSEQEAWATLQQNNSSVKNTIEVLNQKKGSNWSAIVRGGLPQAQPVVQQQQPAAPKAQSQKANQKKKADNQANGHQEKAEKVDPIVKEQDLIRDIENNLEEWAKLKNQLESVKNGELQTNLNKLSDERALLKKRQGELEQELKTIKSTLVTVESEITKLEKEKIQKLKALEEERVRLLAKPKK